MSMSGDLTRVFFFVFVYKLTFLQVTSVTHQFQQHITHLPSIIEAITNNVSGGQMTCQAVFDRQVKVKQADHGQLAETAPSIH